MITSSTRGPKYFLKQSRKLIMTKLCGRTVKYDRIAYLNNFGI